MSFKSAQGSVRSGLTLLPILIFTFASFAFAQCSKTNNFNCAYVTDGPGGNIYAVDRNSGATTKIQSIRGNVTLNDVRLAADNMLYVTTNNSVLKLNPNGVGKATNVLDATNAIPGPFTGIRFSAMGDAYVNSAKGVLRLGPDAGGKHLIQISGSSFPTPVPVTDTACSTSSGGLAVWATGDLLIACNTVVSGNPVYEVLRCPAIKGMASGCTGQNSSIQQLLTTSAPITGLAVDAVAQILVASGNSVSQFDCTNTPCTPTTLATFASDVPAYIDAAPFPPGLSPAQAGSPTPPCNSAAVTVFVSTGDASAKNGKVWTVNTVSTSSTNPPGCDSLQSPVLAQLASVSSSRPAVGMGVASASRTLTELFPDPGTGMPSRLYHYGPFSIQITNDTVNSGCNLSLTAQREAAAPLDAILAQAQDAFGNVIPSRAIPFDGEQSWRTTFHGGFPASNCTTAGDSHMEITAPFQYVNPWIALIDDATGKATLDPIPSIYPGVPLKGVPGDPIGIRNSGLFTQNARIVLVDRGFTVNNAQGYQFVGFFSPLVDPGQPSDNVINAGKSLVLKFELLANGAPVSDTQGLAVVTGLSIARLSCDPSAACAPDQDVKEMLVSPEGQSATPPSFNYVGSGNFHFNQDTNQPDGTEWCNGVYEVTANSDSFSPHTMLFEIVGAPPAPQCY